MNELIDAREKWWSEHPIILRNAVLPTTSILEFVGAVMAGARTARYANAAWADPQTGKSSCLDAIDAHIGQTFPNSGVMRYEAVADERSAEGRLLEAIILELGLGKASHSLAGKRDQLNRALLALAGPDMRLFLLFDEAQEFGINELSWLKTVVNKLVSRGVKVATVLMGQRELLEKAELVKRLGRSDLSVRYFKRITEFRRCSDVEGFNVICEAMDEKSEFPEGSGYTYTQLLFPQAFANKFRFQQHSKMLWAKLTGSLGDADLKRGLGMDTIAAYLAYLCELHRVLDSPEMQLQDKLVARAAREAFK